MRFVVTAVAILLFATQSRSRPKAVIEAQDCLVKIPAILKKRDERLIRECPMDGWLSPRNDMVYRNLARPTNLVGPQEMLVFLGVLASDSAQLVRI